MADILISAVVPIYNEEKYIGKCLAGLLIQTFKDFEVIVIDNCSTDNSVAIVEGYAEKFNGRLKLVRAEEKSEYAGFLRNKGIELAGGEYVFFTNADDAITPTSLEELHTAAKKFDADVVHCKKYYFIPVESDNAEFKSSKPYNWSAEENKFITQPTLLTNDFEKRVKDFSQSRLQWSSSVQLIRRDFLVDNGISFLNVYSQDMIFTMSELCCAKRYLLLPNIFYHWRQRSGLNSQGKSDVPQIIQRQVSTLKQGINYLDEILNRQEFFAARADLKYMLFDTLFAALLGRLDNIYRKVSAHNLYELLRKEFDGDSAFAAFTFNAMNINRLQLNPPPEPLTKPALEILPVSYEKQAVLPKEFPAVSVIIPMYNMEKYIGECLDSLLAQTFQNFEVIVVDDCSTDNCRAVVELYAEKFNGRLKITATEENSAYAGSSRNKGIELAAGEYLYFLDSDDTITPTALEELYTAAKKFDADVVHCEKYYAVPDESYHDAACRKTLKPYSWPNTKKRFITQPTLLTKDLAKRVRDFGQKWLQWASWMQLIRRDFLIDNGIRFLNVYSQDMIFTMCELCLARNYLVVPNIFYYWRQRKDSKTQEQLNTAQTIHKYTSVLKQGANYLDEFLNRQEFFAKRSDLRYVLFNMLFTTILERLDNTYHQVSALELDGLLRKEFDNDNAFTAFTFNEMNIYRLQLNPSWKRAAVSEMEVGNMNIKNQNFPAKKIPAISVIIPLFNAEEYVGECLDSLLNQTFKDFEVIVVDDCSTDNSVAVVKHYVPLFNGQLIFAQTKENSGGGGYVPRNIGLQLSRGEYIQFLDADDFISENALETLYNAARKHDADVVCTNVRYDCDDNGKFFLKGKEDKPTLIINESKKNLQQLLLVGGFFHTPWSKFVRRDFLIENEIVFPKIISMGDFLWTIHVHYCSKRFLKFPYGFYFYRNNSGSLTRKKRDLSNQITVCAKAFLLGIKAFYDLSNKIDLLKQNPIYFRKTLSYFFNTLLVRTAEARMELDSQELYNILFHEFSKEPSDLPFPFLFTFINDEQEEIENFKKICNGADFAKLLTARFDFKFSTTADGDFQILSVSDRKAKLSKPDWLNRDCIGYMVTSCNGSITIVAKATSDGKFRLTLMGMDVRDPKTKKRIPSWIDYTKLTVNGKIIFDKVTPVWHDAPYRQYLDVKAGEELKIQVDWQPHKSEEVAPPPEKIIETVVEKVVEPIDKKFLPYLTGRADIQLTPKTGTGELQILSVSDEQADVTKAFWLPESESGYAVQSHVGNMSIVAKATADGQIKLYLRGMWAQNPDDSSKLLPYWIDYTKLTVNGDMILDKMTPTWHDAPFNYNFDVKAGEEITVDVEWQPHRSDEIAPPPEKVIETVVEKVVETVVEKVVEPIDKKFLPYLTGRADIQLTPKTGTGELQILSVSDDQADVTKAFWLLESESGYAVQSHVGSMSIVAKATTDGQIKLYLRGMWAQNPDDESKLLPYWIDYTKLTVNGDTILNKMTPTWHDAPFNYNFDVKADEEITVEVEWQPHRSDEIAPPPEKVIETVVEKVEQPIDKKFLPYLTARIDVKLAAAGGDFQILSVSDGQADVRKPDWFQRGGIGYQIQSYAGKLEIVAKTTTAGQLLLNLLGLDVRMPGNYSKRIPYWIDYTKLSVNGNNIFDKVTPAWHDKSFNYNLNVKADEEIKISIEWQPHWSDT